MNAVKEMKPPKHFLPEMLNKIVVHSLNRSDEDKELASVLIHELCTEGIVSSEQLMQVCFRRVWFHATSRLPSGFNDSVLINRPFWVFWIIVPTSRRKSRWWSPSWLSLQHVQSSPSWSTSPIWLTCWRMVHISPCSCSAYSSWWNWKVATGFQTSSNRAKSTCRKCYLVRPSPLCCSII